MKISKILIIISLIGIIYIKTFSYIENDKHKEIINNELVGFKNIYSGYIEISNLNIKRLIIEDDYSMLDKGFVVMNKTNNILLFGHAVEYIFLNLHNIEIGEKISLYLDKEYKYVVEDIFTVLEDNYDFSNYDDKLILITCLYDDKKRLVVVAKKDYLINK